MDLVVSGDMVAKPVTGEVIQAVQSYLADDGQWPANHEWQTQVFDYRQSSKGFGVGYGLAGAAIAILLIWKLFLSG